MSINVITNPDPNEATVAASDLAKGSGSDESKSPKDVASAEAIESELADETVGDDDVGSDEGDADDSESQEEKPKKRSKFQRRVAKFRSELSDRDREIAYLKGQLSGRNPQSTDQAKPQTAQAKADGRPNQDDFETHADYVEALTDWKVDQKHAQREAKDRETQLRTESEKRALSFQDKVKAFAETKDDFEEVLESVDDIPLPPALHEVILESNSPELLYELAKDREQFARICKLGPLAAAREIGKIEARLQKADGENQRQEKEIKTSAPAPLNPVGSKSAGHRKTIHDPNISQAEFERLRREQMAKRA